MSAIETVTLPRVGTLKMGETIIEKDCTGEGLPIYSADKSNRPWAFSTHFKRLNKRGTIVLGARGTIGYPRLPRDEEFGATQTTITLTPDSENFQSEFVYFALQQLDFTLLGAQQAIPMLTVGNLESVTIPKFPKPEQTKIAEILSTVDRAIEQTEALIAKQQRLKTGLMQDLLTRGIDEHGNLRSEHTHEFKDSPLGRIPGEWEVKPIKDVGLVVTGNTPSESAFADDYQSVPFVTPADVGVTSAIHKTTRSFGRASAANVRMIPPGSICVVCIGSTIGKIGVTVSEVATNQQINSVIPHEPEISYFLLHSMLLNLPPQLRKEAGLQAVPIVNKSTFERLLIAKPCNSKEAIEIQRQISSPAASAESGTHTLSKLRSLKTALMQDLLTGRKRVTELLNNPEVPA
jgi:type I restriction enzyme, S subunit